MDIKLAITGVFCIIAGAMGTRFAQLFVQKKDPLSGFGYAVDNFANLQITPPLQYTSSEMMIIFAIVMAFALVPLLVYTLLFVMPRPERVNEEHGSARWSTKHEIEQFANKKEERNNILLTQKAKLATKRDKFSLKYDRNLNVMVVGGSGSGKTRYFVKPNLMQLMGNYVLTDPKGTTIFETGHLFEQAGYDIKSFNTIDMSASNYWNPLRYVKTDSDILSFVNCLIANTNGEGKSSDPFWENSERLLYTALIAFLRDWFPPEEYTIPNLIYLLTLAKVEEDNENFQSPLDLLFKQIETGRSYKPKTSSVEEEQQIYDEWNRGLRSSETIAEWAWEPSRFVRQTDGYCPYTEGGLSPSEDYALLHYHNFKQAAGKTLKSIIISCNVRLEPLSISEVSKIMSGPLDKYGNPTGKCELELDKLGDPETKIILYGIISDTDKTFAFLLAILMWQTINSLCNVALDKYSGKLPTLVNFIIDEFANIGILPDIERMIAVTRSRNIALTIILQSIAQLSNNYSEDASKIIRGNCDTQLFLGGTDLETNKEISELLGQQTIHTRSYSVTKGQMPGTSISNQTQERSLLDAAEVGLVDRQDALLVIKGARPYKDHKYILEDHPRYEYIDPGHKPYKKKPARYIEPFDFKRYLKKKRRQQMRLRP